MWAYNGTVLALYRSTNLVLPLQIQELTHLRGRVLFPYSCKALKCVTLGRCKDFQECQSTCMHFCRNDRRLSTWVFSNKIEPPSVHPSAKKKHPAPTTF